MFAIPLDWQFEPRFLLQSLEIRLSHSGGFYPNNSHYASTQTRWKASKSTNYRAGIVCVSWIPVWQTYSSVCGFMSTILTWMNQIRTLPIISFDSKNKYLSMSTHLFWFESQKWNCIAASTQNPLGRKDCTCHKISCFYLHALHFSLHDSHPKYWIVSSIQTIQNIHVM